MKILLVGGGGREHALAWIMAKVRSWRSCLLHPEMREPLSWEPMCPSGWRTLKGSRNWCWMRGSTWWWWDPKHPWWQGSPISFKDDPELKNVPVIGPSKAGAELEGSKDFAKVFMQDNNIPTGEFRTFIDYTISEGKTIWPS